MRSLLSLQSMFAPRRGRQTDGDKGETASFDGPFAMFFHGQMGARQIKALDVERAAIPGSVSRVLLATGSYIGEGFDDARLDSLFSDQETGC